MATDNKKIAAEVLAAVGGAANITSATHCMTRLRLNLKDQSIPNDEQVKAIKGVLGAQWSGGQYQVIIGQNVPKVYDAALALGVSGEGAINENLDGALAANEPLTPKVIGKAIMNYLSKSMVGIIPVFIAAAFFRTVATVLGPDMIGLWMQDSAEYVLFHDWLYNAGFYFLPILLGWSAARQLGASQPLGMMMGGVLIAPELLAIVADAATTGATTMSVYGLPAPINTYTTTVLPIILCIPALWQVEKFFKRVLPTAIESVLTPFLTMVVMVPVALCVLAPLGGFLGSLIGDFMFGLGNSGGILTALVLAVVAALWEFLVMTGITRSSSRSQSPSSRASAAIPASWSQATSPSSRPGAWRSARSCACAKATRRARSSATSSRALSAASPSRRSTAAASSTSARSPA